MIYNIRRAQIEFRGVVQGVGFRPTLFRLAKEAGFKGWIQNTGVGVAAEIEGSQPLLEAWLESLAQRFSPPTHIDSVVWDWLPPSGFTDLEIRESLSQGPRSAQIPADISICGACIQDMETPGHPREGYPFTSCTQCGPRYSLIESIPFDREVTTMRDFPMCGECNKEYSDPQDRRFHSQTNCCPKCGPHLSLRDASGKELSQRENVWPSVQQALSQGKIIAVKGLGGFQLVCSAAQTHTVQKLRLRKHRPSKAFALMFRSLAEARKVCAMNPDEEALLQSQAAPIVLVRRLPGDSKLVDPLVAPDTSRLGLMLPTTGIHIRLTKLSDEPLIVTSGNLSGEPICTDESMALKKLSPIADLFLVHNRRIVRAVDDSVVQVVQGRSQILRRARGYAPLSIQIPTSPSSKMPTTLALGGHLKNTIALNLNDKIFLSQHLGDLDNVESFSAFVQTCEDFKSIYGVKDPIIACDLHSDYQSSRLARELSAAPHLVQHHWAHAMATKIEHQIEYPFLGVVWDGTGYGADGTSWGGEFLLCQPGHFERVGHLRNFRLPGGDLAAREPQRSLAGLLFEMQKQEDLTGILSPILKTMLLQKLNSPITSSVGRLFDGVASLVGLDSKSRSPGGEKVSLSYEGEAAIRLQTLAESWNQKPAPLYQPRVLAKKTDSNSKGVFILDWEPLLHGLCEDLSKQAPPARIAMSFHISLVDGLIQMTELLGEKRIALSGGCFQNQLLLDLAIRELQKKGFSVFWPQQIPPNDGGISLGQLVISVSHQSNL